MKRIAIVGRGIGGVPTGQTPADRTRGAKYSDRAPGNGTERVACVPQ
jgi:hypothetical protein